MGQPNPLVIW